MTTIGIVWRFVWHICLGAFLFSIIAVVATLLYLGVALIEGYGAPTHIVMIARYVTEGIWFADIGCFVLFFIGETIGLVRLIILVGWLGRRL